MLLDVKRTLKWIAALEANGHRQITNELNDDNNGVCALGLYQEIEGYNHYVQNYLQIAVQLCISVQMLHNIVNLNDGTVYMMKPWEGYSPSNLHRTRRHTFAEIANILKIRLRAQMEFLNADGTKKTTVLPTLEITDRSQKIHTYTKGVQ